MELKKKELIDSSTKTIVTVAVFDMQWLITTKNATPYRVGLQPGGGLITGI
jgi:hypothetical protein